MPYNDAAKNLALTALGAGVVTHIGIHSAVDPGTGLNCAAGEATGGSPAYARQAVTWAASASAQMTGSSGTLTFDVPAGSYGFFTMFNHVSTNSSNYRGYLPFGGAVRSFGTANAADVTANTISSAAHGLANGDRVMLFNVFAESLPTGLTEGVLYFVVGITTDTFQVSLTLGGSAVDITAVGELFYQKVVVEVFGGQGQITAGANVLIQDLTTV